MNNLFLKILITVFLLSSCTVGKKTRFAHRDLDLYKTDQSIAQYFMSDIPSWANNSRSGSCKRNIAAKYFDFKILRSSFSIDYHQSLQFQYLYNIEYWKRRRELQTNYLTFQDEYKIFYDTSDKVMANIFPFKRPTYNKVSILWIDPLINNSQFGSLKKIIKSARFGEGHPVIASLCLSHQELKDFLKSQKLMNNNVKLITFEMLTLFKEDSSIGTGMALDFTQLFKKKQTLYLYLPTKQIPIEFDGKFIIRKY